MDRESRRPEPDIRDSLSPREHQLLTLAEQGFTDNGISNRLGISLATVGTYWGRIRIKFGPLSRTELVANYLKEEASRTVDALKEDNERLLTEVSEHSRHEEALQATLELFQNLIESAPDAILLVTEQGEVQLANAQSHDLFGYEPGELIGKLVDQLMPERFREEHAGHRHDYVENPSKRLMGEHLATIALRKDGSEFLMATALSATQTPKGWRITCIVRNLSETMEQRLAVAVADDVEV